MSRRKTTKQFKNNVQKLTGKEYSVLGKYVNNKIKIQIKHNKCHHIYYVRPNDFISGYRCPYCNGNKARHLSQKKFDDRISNFSNGKYKVIGKYKNAHTPVAIQHLKCGYIWKIRPTDFYNGNRCPYCKQSYGEQIVRKWLIQHHLSFKTPYKIHLRNNRLDFMFIFNNQKYGIEVDGLQHFKLINWNYKYSFKKQLIRFKNQKIRDKRKNIWCIKNNIPLIRIEWNTHYCYLPAIKQFIDNILNKELKEMKNNETNNRIYRWWFKNPRTLQRRSFEINRFRRVGISY